MLVGVLGFLGLFILQPNLAMVLVVFGRYTGTARREGWWWANPLAAFQRRRVSLRVRNFQSAVSKVNDASGSPIEIAAVVVWRITNTAAASFDVFDVDDFVHIQTETAVRHLAVQFPYDDPSDEVTSLRGNTDLVAAGLVGEVRERLALAGVEVFEARITHLAYAPEIAEAMLRRQQAQAVVAARQRIVDGAVGMVTDALDRLQADHVVELDEERKATMVANLMVVLCGEHQATPVVNVGTLYP